MLGAHASGLARRRPRSWRSVFRGAQPGPGRPDGDATPGHAASCACDPVGDRLGEVPDVREHLPHDRTIGRSLVRLYLSISVAVCKCRTRSWTSGFAGSSEIAPRASRKISISPAPASPTDDLAAPGLFRQVRNANQGASAAAMTARVCSAARLESRVVRPRHASHSLVRCALKSAVFALAGLGSLMGPPERRRTRRPSSPATKGCRPRYRFAFFGSPATMSSGTKARSFASPSFDGFAVIGACYSVVFTQTIGRAGGFLNRPPRRSRKLRSP